MIIIFIIFGLLFGSFCNVCIARLPAGVSIFWPPSSCCACGARVKPWHNMPVLSYFILRGRCANCGVKFGAGYLISELFCAGIFTAVGYFGGYDASMAGIAECFFEGGHLRFINDLLTGICFSLIFVLCIIDFQHFAVPELCLLTALIIAAYVRSSNIATGLICIGAVIVLKAFCEFFINLLRPEYFEQKEQIKALKIDSSSWAIFNALLLVFLLSLSFFANFELGKFFYSQNLFKALQISALSYLAISLIAAVLNEIFNTLKIKVQAKAQKLRIQKEILGAADIEMIGILALFLGKASAVFAAVFAAAVLMICAHVVKKIFNITWKPKDLPVFANSDEHFRAQMAEIPASALPFFPFLAIGLLILMAYPELAGVFGV